MASGCGCGGDIVLMLLPSQNICVAVLVLSVAGHFSGNDTLPLLISDK